MNSKLGNGVRWLATLAAVAARRVSDALKNNLVAKNALAEKLLLLKQRAARPSLEEIVR